MGCLGKYTCLLRELRCDYFFIPMLVFNLDQPLAPLGDCILDGIG